MDKIPKLNTLLYLSSLPFVEERERKLTKLNQKVEKRKRFGVGGGVGEYPNLIKKALQKFGFDCILFSLICVP